MKRFLFLVCVFSILNGPALARDIRFEVTLDRTKVSIGSTANLKLAFYGTQDIVRPDLPDIRGFNWQYIGPFLKMSIVNGKTTTSITHNYVLAPLEVGEFSIPPLSVYYNGKTYTSEPIPIEVVSGPVSQPPPVASEEESYGREAGDLDDRIFLTMDAEKRRAYVNETIPVTVKLYINRLAIKEIHYPEFTHKGFSADKFDEHKQYKEVLRGIPYDVVEFNTYVSGMRPGSLRLGPAFLKCNLLIKRNRRRWRSQFDDDEFFGPSPFGSFFGSYERRPLNLKSADIPITVVELPVEGMPSDFTGAIGNYRFYLEANPKDVKVGDPITLKMTITGEGNFNTIKVPPINADNNFKLYDPEVKQDQTGKIFEQIIIPKSDDIKEIPPITFSFFDTASGQYRKITRGPIPINVSPLPSGERLRIFETPGGVTRAAREREILGRDIIYIKEDPGALAPKSPFLCKNKLFIAIQFIPLFAVIFTLISHRKKERLEKDIPYARRLRAPRKARKNLREVKRLLASGEPAGFFDAVFKTLQEYLGDKFQLPTAGITSEVVETLESYNIDKEILNDLRECFQSCDTARYAKSLITKEEMTKALALLEEIIDRLERVKS